MSGARAPLFVTRKFPPSVGGMETLAEGVWDALRTLDPRSRLIAHGGSNRALPLWIPLAVLRVLVRTLHDRPSVVLTGDALMAAVLEPLLRLARIPHATMVMGLDVTFDNRLYRAVVLPRLRRIGSVMAISRATADACLEVGLRPANVHVVPLGVAVPPVGEQDRAAARRRLDTRLGTTPDDAVLLTLGRLVRRKGVAWFVSAVLPSLPDSVHYVVVGSGPDEQAVRDAVAAAGVADRVHLLGRVDDAQREDALRGADVFVQPNIPVTGDMEGFGLVVIEAAQRGTLVVASELEGIRDATVDGVTARLVAPQAAPDWIDALTPLIGDLPATRATGQRFQLAARERFGPSAMQRALAERLVPRG